MDNILISWAGGPAAVGAIKSLKQTDVKNTFCRDINWFLSITLTL